MLHLRSSIGFSIALSIELHLESFGQLIKSRKKNRQKFWDIQLMTHITPKTWFEGPLWDVLRTSWGNQPSRDIP